MVRPQSVLDAVPIQSLESAKLHLKDRPHCRREVRPPREPLALTAALAWAGLCRQRGGEGGGAMPAPVAREPFAITPASVVASRTPGGRNLEARVAMTAPNKHKIMTLGVL